MKKFIGPFVGALLSLLTMAGCGPSVHLTASWHDAKEPPARFSKILVLAIGKDLRKRQMAETAICDELHRRDFTARSGIDEFGPSFGQGGDSAMEYSAMQDRGFDGILTVRVLSVDEHDRWVPGTTYYGPIGFYRGFYGYYHRVWGYYSSPGYQVTDVKVLLESNCYRVSTGALLWSGQSEALSRNPTRETAHRYAKNIVADLLSNGVIQP
ncbi:MAG TPA: hypothetical protein VN616_17500 [Puia sp.]|nr:hypothetical protein [Puia sp.]